MKLADLPFFKKQKEKKVKIPILAEPSESELVRQILAPPAVNFSLNYFQIGETYGRSILILTYPKFLFSGWLDKILEMDLAFNISLFIYPIDTPVILKKLEKQLAKIEAQISEREKYGFVRSPELETAYKDIEMLRDALVQAREKMFEVGVYITHFAETLEKLNHQEKLILNQLEKTLMVGKPVVFQQKESWYSSMPLLMDQLQSTYQLNTSPLATFFPFISAELSADQGVVFGINLQNNSLVILDRFSFQNAHMVIFAQSGSGKSYTAKIEAMRSLMLGTDVIILDPEGEYKSITEIYNGVFIPIDLTSDIHLNPFDLPPLLEDENPIDVFKEKTADLIGLIKLLIGELTPEELTIIDQAISQTYAAFNIFPEKDFSKAERFPTLNDFEKVLRGIQGGEKIADRLYPYTQGNFAGFINQPTNIELDKRLVVFGFRNLQDELRPIGMYIALNYVFSTIKRQVKKRVVIIDEAWWLMKNEAGANFLFDVVKRGRKYMVGLTTITQDVEDFLNSPYGKPIITNSALVFLMKQSPATIDLVGEVFRLSEGEKKFLLQSERGRGILFAGLKHVPLYVLPSYAEDQIIKSSPEQLMAIKKAKERLSESS